MTLFAAFTAGSGLHWLSSTIALMVLPPSTPPLWALEYSSMASSAPSRVMAPKVGWLPLRGANTAILISVAAAGAAAPPQADTTTASSKRTLITLNVRMGMFSSW